MGRVVSMNHPPGCLRSKCKSFLEGWIKVGTFCMVSSSTRTEKFSQCESELEKPQKM